MQNLLEHTHLPRRAQSFLQSLLSQFPHVVRERELHWQLKMLSRYAAEREFFDSCITQKSHELSLLLPYVSISGFLPAQSVPLSSWYKHNPQWPPSVLLLTQIYLQQIFLSSDIFLDLGSEGDAFFVAQTRDKIVWVPDSRGTRWHEPFRMELARLYLGWAFEQEKLIDAALRALHLIPLKDEILKVLEHWRGSERRTRAWLENQFHLFFSAAEQRGVCLHPNILVWMLYELEICHVLAEWNLEPDLEQCADDLCRMQSQISA
ncbi:MAG: hypothetical protein RIR26_615 [Pseudomonadota bacterium]